MKIAPKAPRARLARLPLPVLSASLAVAALAVTGCGGGDDDGGPAPAGAKRAAPAAPSAKDAITVDIASFKFMPQTVKVKKGGAVTFVNKDKAPHTAQTELNPKTAVFDTGRLAKGQKKVVKAADAGRFEYFCAYHRFMEGTVEVVE